MTPGDTFGRLTAIRELGRDYHRKMLWEFLCECGTVVSKRIDSVIRGKTQSCGCFNAEVRCLPHRRTHGHAGKGRNTKTYRVWWAAKQRCFDPKNISYLDYGGRGISMCDEWRYSFETFLHDMGECPSGLQIDRINNDGDYEPGNCRWATRSQQAFNRRTKRV